MAASGTRERRPAMWPWLVAVWPWLVMPLVVLIAFYTLKRVRERPGPPVVPPPAQTTPAAPATGQ